MKHFKSLYRSPIKSILTLLLLTVAVFLLLYNLSDYSVSQHEYTETRSHYEGVLTLQESDVQETSGMPDLFLLTDQTNPGRTFGQASYDTWHHESLQEDTIRDIEHLPYISRVEKRYMTAGVSPDYTRLDTDVNFTPFAARCVITATVEKKDDFFYSSKLFTSLADHGLKCIAIRDVELLAGDPAWLEGFQDFTFLMMIVKEELRDQYARVYWSDFVTRDLVYSIDPQVFQEDYDRLEPGHKYVFVLRNIITAGANAEGFQQGENGPIHSFVMGDDSLIDWWPYYSDITDLPENWLETEDYAALRELIQVTNDDVHTFDVVYGDDMAAIRRVSEGRIVCVDGRFITPEDAGQPVCVVNEDLAKAYDLEIGDTLTLNLGNYLCEQYAPLGAVASNRGRQSTSLMQTDFTIIGIWSDLNEGSHVFRDRYWCYSNNAVFVPTSFLPDCANEEEHTFKPAEVSFVVGNAEDILPFIENVVPQLDALEKDYSFTDAGWIDIAEDLMRARDLAFVKLLIFAVAAVLALFLAVWLYIGRKKKEFGVFRALGMPARESKNRLFIPFLLLGAISTIVGFLVSLIATNRQLTGHAPQNIAVLLIGMLGFLLILTVIAQIGLLFICRKSILELTQEKQK